MNELRKLRTKTHLSLKQLAQKTGISESSLVWYEHGRDIPGKRIHILATFFNCSAEKIMDWDDLNYKEPLKGGEWVCPHCKYKNTIPNREIKKYASYRRKGGDNDFLDVYCHNCFNHFIAVMGSSVGYFVKGVKK